MRRIVSILFLLISLNLNAQVTIIVDELPLGTPKNTQLYISGSFEGWSGGKKEYQLEKKGKIFSIRLENLSKNILFKFTQGSWKTVESSKEGTSIDNRTYNFDKSNDTLKIKIAGWSHLISKKKSSTAAKNVTVFSELFEIPQLKRKRKVRIYLPPGYHKSKETYPVVYMHDGQNLFDKETSFSGEWSVDETLNKLYEEQNLKLIVVGIDNGGAKRLDEYSPWKNEKYGGGEGDEYLDFITKTLKPFIDSNYKTLKNKKNTAIIGSSMGGLISHYAALKYPSIFGKVGVYSPAFWFAPKVFDFTKNHSKLIDTRMYFLAGGKEGGNTAYNEINQTVKDMNKMVHVLKKNGFSSNNLISKVVPDGKHNEKLWRNNFEETIKWLFKNHETQREFVNSSLTNNQLHIHVSDGKYIIKYYTSNTVETTFIPKDQQENLKKSHAVVLKPQNTNIDYKEENQNILYRKDKFLVKVTKKPFHISYWYKENELISEKNGYQRNDEFETLQFNITPKEILYGGGARALGMNRRGNRLQLYNKAHYGYEEKSSLMNFTMPLVYSSKQYAIHFDNAPIGYLDLDSKKKNTLTYETISGRKTYQIVAGNSWLDLIDNYTSLTGKQPMLPRWALGNFSSRFGYHSQKETENTIQKFKDEKIPVDAFILDLFWFGKDIQGTMGNLEVYKDSFPDMKGMVSKFKKQGVKTVLITEPFILSTSKKWDEAVEKNILAKDSVGNPARFDFYFGNTGIVDIYNKKGRDWFWNIYKEIRSLGVKGFWGDLGEPEVHPTWVQHASGSANEVHNIYGHDWAKLIYEGYQKEYANERPFILMRAGYSGSQRFGMVPWSGDVNRSWGGLQSQPEIALQMGMQGMAYMHSDLGGFAGANLNDELYTRWLQYGVFQPIFRPHAQEEVPSEPVFRSEKAKMLAKQSIKLRYSLLPYNYQLVFENNQYGKPLMRPLFFNDKELKEVATSYLWGNDFLVSPVLASKVKEQQVYFPKDAVWFDFYTDEKINGNQVKKILVKESSIPTYVKGGAFIPLAKAMQTTDEYNFNIVDIHYYHDDTVNNSKSQLYNDDGETANAFEKGMFELVTFKSESNNNLLKIHFSSKIGKQYSTSKKKFDLIIHNISNTPQKVRIGNRNVKFYWSSKNKTIRIPVKWNTKNDKEISIKL